MDKADKVLLHRYYVLREKLEARIKDDTARLEQANSEIRRLEAKRASRVI